MLTVSFHYSDFHEKMFFLVDFSNTLFNTLNIDEIHLCYF